MRNNAVLFAALLSVSAIAAPAQKDPLLEKAHEAYVSAQALEGALNEKPEADRTRAEYLQVIRAYQRVYVITPHTSHADNSLMTGQILFADGGFECLVRGARSW